MWQNTMKNDSFFALILHIASLKFCSQFGYDFEESFGTIKLTVTRGSTATKSATVGSRYFFCSFAPKNSALLLFCSQCGHGGDDTFGTVTLTFAREHTFSIWP